MSFKSFDYLIFFPIVVTLYFMLPQRRRWAFLLAASCYFYIVFIPVYILVLFALIVVDYTTALWMEKAEGRARKALLWLSILSTCSILFVFKYFDFFNANFNALAQALHWNYSIKSLSLVLPLGLSFHTFQSLSYVFEVYEGRQKAERHFGIYALYVMFFPQLVAGPIERPQHLLPQLYQYHRVDYERITDGLKLMAWGFFKKIVIADRLAVCVNTVYNDPTHYSGPPLILATVFFAFQLYCDFSGYSDIAIGSAQVMGFRLTDNFNRPFMARTTAEFWRRWHISLSSWFFDYVYNPIAIATRNWGVWSIVFTLMVTFFILGLWHGASWKFVVFGLLQGAVISIDFLTRKKRKALCSKLPAMVDHGLGIALTFSFFSFSLIFFRADNIRDGFYILGHLFDFTHVHELVHILRAKAGTQGILGLSKLQILGSGILIGFILWAENIQQELGFFKVVACLPFPKRWAIYYLFILAIVFFGCFQPSPFIYFQF